MDGAADIDEALISEPMTERHGRLLAAFAARAARLAEDLADRMLAADSPEQAAALAKAFHTVGRSLRQAIALEQRLERAAAQAVREHRETAERARGQAVERRKRQLRDALRPLAWSESEALDFSLHEDEGRVRAVWRGGRLDDIEALIETCAEEDPAAFAAEPLAAQLARFQAVLQLDGEGFDGDEDDQGADGPAADAAQGLDPGCGSANGADSS